MNFLNFYQLISNNSKDVSSEAIEEYKNQIKNLEIELSKTSDASEREFFYSKIENLNEHIRQECESYREYNREVLICGTLVVLSGIGYLTSQSSGSMNT